MENIFLFKINWLQKIYVKNQETPVFSRQREIFGKVGVLLELHVV